MAGKIKNILDYIINSRSAGDPVIAEVTKSKLILKGINPDNFDANSPDDPIIMKKVLEITDLLFEPLPVYDDHIRAAYTKINDELSAVEDIRQQLSGLGSEFLIYFASSSYDQKKLSYHMNRSFRNTAIIGCSTAGEITTGKLTNHSVSAIAMDQKVIQSAKVEVVDLSNIKESLDNAFSSFENFYGISTHLMNPQQYIGVILIDGLSMKEEILMDLIGNKTNVLFVGASAGDDLQFVKTHVSAAPDSFENAAVLALLKISAQSRFRSVKAQSFRSLDKFLTANNVNEERREVIEFNGKPALEAYADALGVDKESAHEYFSKNPVGLLIGDKDIFVRSPREAIGTRISFYCNIQRGETVSLLESTDIIEDTRAVLNDLIREFGHIDGLINFNCILRTVELDRQGKTEQYGNLLRDFTTAGFSTYGEEFIGHINQTTTMIAFSVDKESDETYSDEIHDSGMKANLRNLRNENHLLIKDNDHLNRKLKQTIASLKEFNHLLAFEITERTKYANQVEYMSYHDILTNMYNRRFFNEILEKLDTPVHLPFTVVMGDVNGLKKINDTFGHIEGDELLKKVACVIKKTCRENDIPVRWGGDEFVILMPETSEQVGDEIVSRICEEYKNEFIKNRQVSVAFGVATKTKPEEDFDQILKLSEERMYEKKFQRRT